MVQPRDSLAKRSKLRRREENSERIQWLDSCKEKSRRHLDIWLKAS
jgi:hypothetical protein